MVHCGDGLSLISALYFWDHHFKACLEKRTKVCGSPRSRISCPIIEDFSEWLHYQDLEDNGRTDFNFFGNRKELSQRGSRRPCTLDSSTTHVDSPLQAASLVLQNISNSGKIHENGLNAAVFCPICSSEITSMSIQQREDHSNLCLDQKSQHCQNDVPSAVECLDKKSQHCQNDVPSAVEEDQNLPVDVAPVVRFLEKLNLSKYASLFIKEEIDWDTLHWLTEEDLRSLGIDAFGPRKKIVSALREMKTPFSTEVPVPENDTHKTNDNEEDEALLPQSGKKYITDFFGATGGTGGTKPASGRKRNGDASLSKTRKKPSNLFKAAEARQWMKIPGTTFRVDAFKHTTTECSHWFLTHFHSDHYQGLTKSFRFGKIYCSMITARLVNLRIGITWDRLHPLNFNERTKIDGVWVTLLDANHCPGAAMILFETHDGKFVLHTGDFRFCDDMARIMDILPCRLSTLVLDTTYCDPQYDFPKQETVIQFVIDAIQAESFNPSTLFLIGTYSLGKERLFLEVARVLRKKIYVGAVKRRMLGCLDLSDEDMDWITTSECESSIHVVPLWSIASFKRMASISRHYHGKYTTIVSFSPTGWSFSKGKRGTGNGKRWQQGTIIRYEVPYSEHSSFTELKTFVKLLSPVEIIPSVNNSSIQAAKSMVGAMAMAMALRQALLRKSPFNSVPRRSVKYNAVELPTNSYNRFALKSQEEVEHDLHEISKWKKITLGMIIVCLCDGFYVYNHPEVHEPRKEYPYMNVRHKDFPWGEYLDLEARILS
ncbi:hypothetical protein SELMODRAFT_415475 [Selaginella moellendorffii]|uniref:SAM domain-containing protein n=1 Tax=Selaginella moellendorffii TaxID=88036 RepID=D8RW82_SELML|nr:hypothetical protein SELMODRAFT_415475 [Selaginella moellendorffii]